MSKMVPPTTAQPAAAQQPPPAYGAAQMKDLCDSIDFSKTEILNANGDVSSILKQGLRDQQAMFVTSDTDEQLLLHVSFTSTVKVHSISIEPGAAEEKCHPKQVKLFVNQSTIGFSDAEARNAEQELEIEPNQYGERLELRFVKFQNVNQLTIFFGSNQGDDDVTAVGCIRLWGALKGETNMKEFKRVAGEKGEGE